MLQRAPVYPQEHNLFNEFFSILDLALSTESAGALNNVKTLISFYEEQHRSLAITFTPSTQAINPEPPTPDQLELFDIETLMLCMLRIIYAVQQKEHGEESDQEQFRIDTITLRFQLKHNSSFKNAIAHSMHYFLTICIEIFLLEDAFDELNDEDVEEMSSSAMTIMDAILNYKKIFGKLSTHSIPHVRSSFAEEMQQLIYVMVYDTKPETSSQKFATYIVSVLVARLIRLHDQLEVKMRAASQKSTRSYIYHQACHRLACVDSITRRLNMIEYPDQRDLFLKQGQRYHRHSKSFDITLWCNSTRAENLFLYLQGTVTGLYTKLDHIQLLDYYLQALKTARKNYNPEYDVLLLHHLNMMLFKIRLVRQHSNELNDEREPNETDIAYFMRMSAQKEMRQGINLLISTIGGMWENITRVRQIETPPTQWMGGVLQNISEIDMGIISFRDVLTDLASVNLGMIIEIKTGMMLQRATTDNAREEVIAIIINDMIDLMSRIDAERDSLSRDKQIFAKQFLLDLYFTTVMQCTSNSATRPLIAKRFLDLMHLQLTGLQNAPFYKVIESILIPARERFIPIDEIDADYFIALSAAELDALLDKCQAAIDRVGNNLYRISTTIRIFFLKYTDIFLTALSTSTNKSYARRAKKMLTQLDDNFYKSVMLFTKECFNTMLELKILHEPVRFKLSSSFDPDLDKKVINPKKNNSTPPAKAQTPTRRSEPPASQPQPASFDVLLSYEDNLKRMDNDPAALHKKYEKAPLVGKKPKENTKVLLGLAHHLEHMSDDPEARLTLVKKLQKYEAGIFRDCKTYLSAEEIKVLQAQYESLIKPWLPASKVHEERPQQVQLVLPKQEAKVATKPKFKKIEQPHKKKQPTSNLVRVSVFSSQNPLPVPVKKLPLPLPPVPPKPIDPCEAIRKPLSAPIKLTALQDAIYAEMEKIDLNPMFQGGSVQDSMYGIAGFDVDFICATVSEDHIVKFIKDNMQKFNIVNYRKNKSSPTYVLQFDVLKVDLEDEKMELAFVIVKSKAKIPRALRKHAYGYGLKTSYADKKSLLDPTDQFPLEHCQQGQLKIHVEDLISGNVGVDLKKYFNEFPERIFDILYKMAKYKKHHYIIPFKPDIQEGIDSARQSFIDYLPKLPTEKFNKIFMRGFATETFDIWHAKNLRFIQLLFPQLTAEQLPLLREACVKVDERIKKDKYRPLTFFKRETLRAKFISEFLFEDFTQHPDFENMSKDETTFHIECAKFLLKSRCKIPDELINRVQAIWWERVRLELEEVGEVAQTLRIALN